MDKGQLSQFKTTDKWFKRQQVTALVVHGDGEKFFHRGGLETNSLPVVTKDKRRMRLRLVEAFEALSIFVACRLPVSTAIRWAAVLSGALAWYPHCWEPCPNGTPLSYRLAYCRVQAVRKTCRAVAGGWRLGKTDDFMRERISRQIRRCKLVWWKKSWKVARVETALELAQKWRNNNPRCDCVRVKPWLCRHVISHQVLTG